MDTLSYLFGSEIKAKLLRTLLTHPTEAYHLRGLASAAQVESGNALKSLRGLVEARLVQLVPDSRGVRYQADTRSPLFEPLRQIFLVSGDLISDLKEVAQQLPADQVLVFGSVAKGTDRPDSDIDVLVVGDLSSIEAQAAFKPVGRKHRRDVSVMVVSREILSKQVAENSPFWRDILDNKIVMLKGNQLDASLGATSLD